MSKLINKEALRQSLIKVKQYIDDKLFGNSESLKDLISEEISKGLSTIVDSAPETLDTLKEVAEYIAKDEQHAVEVTTTLSNHESAIQSLQTDNVIVKGDVENSAVLKGGDNQVISEGGVALGENNVVGLKGWYYSSIYKENKNTISVYLSNKQKSFSSDEDFKTESQIADKSLPNLVEILGVNAVISLVNAGKYDDKFIVIGGNNGVVRLQTIDKSVLPFDIITGQSVINYEDYSIYCLSKPDAGIAELGKYSFAVGYNNKATNGESTAFGYNNHAYGKFSFVEGKDNKAGYLSHAEGRSNTASGSISHAEGRDNVASGYLSHVEGGYNIAEGAESHAEGYYTTAKGTRSHAEGTETIAKGDHSHAEGVNTTAIGDRSHAEGNDTKAGGINSHAEGNKSHSLGPHSHAEGNETKTEGSCAHAEGYKSQAMGRYSHAEGSNTITKNEAEHACGKHNSSTQSNDSAQATRFSIGIGTSDTNRKNAVEVKRNGDVYIIGVGGYDGNNPGSSEDLATVIGKCGGADWNAKEGEAGYIENRPCYVNLDNGHRITLDNADITLSSDENWYEKIIIPFHGSKISLYFYTSYGELIHYVLTEGQSVFDYHFGCKFTAVLNEYYLCDLLLTDFGDPKEYVDNVFAETKLVYDYDDTVVQKLDSEYLPDTVIKTTPQTLSDTDKNQALTNLGIDPVIWKYMSNPHIVEYDKINYECNNAVPKELSDKIYQNGKFNPLVLSTILVKIYDISEEGGFDRVERITSYCENNVIFDGEQFGYNKNTRKFVI